MNGQNTPIEPITDMRLKVLRAMAKDKTSIVRWGTADVQELIARIDQAEAAVERVKALHKPVDVEPSDTICGHCSFQLPNGRFFGKVEEWPCPTVRAITEALNGETDD